MQTLEAFQGTESLASEVVEASYAFAALVALDNQEEGIDAAVAGIVDVLEVEVPSALAWLGREFVASSLACLPGIHHKHLVEVEEESFLCRLHFS